jgi:hypothetical protein
MKQILIPAALSALLLVLASTPGLAQPNAVEKNSYEAAVFTIELIAPDGQVETIVLKGLVDVEVNFEGPVNGMARDNDGDAREEVVTEIVGMDLAGNSSYGPVRVSRAPSEPSLGLFEERVNDVPEILDVAPYAASGQIESFFDVFFQIGLGGMGFFNATPHRIGGTLTHNPAAPADLLTGSQNSILYDAIGNPTGWFLRVISCQLSEGVEIDRFETATAELVLIAPTGTSEVVTLIGTATVEATFEGTPMGAANDDDFNGMDEISTELVALTLIGASPNVGRVTVGERTDRTSVGVIEEQENPTPAWLDLAPFTPGATATSFFDVFFTLDLGGEQLTTVVASRISGVVTYKPSGPGDVLVGVERVDLLTAAGALTGWSMTMRTLWLGDLVTGVSGESLPGLRAQILHAAPNPFNPRVRVYFRAEEAGPASLRVFDLRGQLVATLHDGNVGVGEQSWVWDGRGSTGRLVASGVYVLRLETLAGTTHRKISLVR